MGNSTTASGLVYCEQIHSVAPPDFSKHELESTPTLKSPNLMMKSSALRLRV